MGACKSFFFFFNQFPLESQDQISSDLCHLRLQSFKDWMEHTLEYDCSYKPMKEFLNQIVKE